MFLILPSLSHTLPFNCVNYRRRLMSFMAQIHIHTQSQSDGGWLITTPRGPREINYEQKRMMIWLIIIVQSKKETQRHHSLK